ncbi:LPXTG cell wall anchor domain-containing protein, partial [Staphylococcus aureus]
DSDSDSDSDSDAGKHTPVKPMSTTKDHHNKAKALPEPGNEKSGSNNPTLFGGLFAALGSLLLFGRRKNKINNTAYTRSVRPGFLFQNL